MTKFTPTRPTPSEHTEEAWSLPDELLLECRYGGWVVIYEAENPPGSGQVSKYAVDVPDVLVSLLVGLPGAERVK